jgi:thiol-disulfide isomerase/thioredoxin
VGVLEPGASFPPITLNDAKGAPLPKSEGETLYVVFKTTCPTCEFTWPYLERLRQSAGPTGLRIVAISQDPPDKAAAFNARLGSRVETAFDLQPWPASNRLGVDTVPSFFRVTANGKLAEKTIGFSRDRMEGLAERAAAAAGKPYQKLFHPGEQIPSTKAG